MVNQVLTMLRGATGRRTIEEALAWIAEGHRLEESADLHQLLQAIVAADLCSGEAREAVRRLARMVAESDLDTASVIFAPEAISPPSRYRRVLDLLAWKSPTHSLDGITAEAVTAAQREDSFTMEVLCTIAGLSHRDLRERLGEQIPSEPSGHWTPRAVIAAFRVVDAVVRGKESTNVPGAIAAGPVELILRDSMAKSAEAGWQLVERMRCDGIPYEVLLAQRTVGSAWGAHRNKTSSAVVPLIVGRLCGELDERGISYRRSTSAGGGTKPAEIRRLAGGTGQIGVLVLASTGDPAYAVAFSMARDGGTARKNAGRLQGVVKAAGVPVAVVVAGAGWSSRNETAELAVSVGGRLYSDRSIPALARTIQVTVNHLTERRL